MRKKRIKFLKDLEEGKIDLKEEDPEEKKEESKHSPQKTLNLPLSNSQLADIIRDSELAFGGANLNSPGIPWNLDSHRPPLSRLSELSSLSLTGSEIERDLVQDFYRLLHEENQDCYGEALNDRTKAKILNSAREILRRMEEEGRISAGIVSPIRRTAFGAKFNIEIRTFSSSNLIILTVEIK